MVLTFFGRLGALDPLISNKTAVLSAIRAMVQHIKNPKGGNIMNQFKETLNRFNPALVGLDYSTYWEWMLISDDLKAAALYVQFYDTLTLAWIKTQKPFIDEEVAVSTLMQYLIKNVEIIKQNRNRFTPNYLYKVAFNAFYPLGRIKRDIDRFNCERSLYEYVPEFKSQCDEDADNNYYWDSLYVCKAVTEDVIMDSDVSAIWTIIESCDEETKKVIESLIGGRKLGKKLSAKAPKIIEELKIKLYVYNR